jgi:hypothetical protein
MLRMLRVHGCVPVACYVPTHYVTPVLTLVIHLASGLTICVLQSWVRTWCNEAQSCLEGRRVRDVMKSVSRIFYFYRVQALIICCRSPLQSKRICSNNVPYICSTPEGRPLREDITSVLVRFLRSSCIAKALTRTCPWREQKVFSGYECGMRSRSLLVAGGLQLSGRQSFQCRGPDLLQSPGQA